MKDRRKIYLLSVLSFMLLISAMITIGITYSSPDKTNLKEWKITISDVNSNSRYIIDDVTLVYNVKLDTKNKEQEVLFTVKNEGDINAILSNFINTDYSKIVVGTSNETNKTYYLSDYINLSINNYNSNKDNSIDTNSNINKGDLLNKRTSNIVSIKVSLKDKLNQDMMNVFNAKGINANLSLSLNYVQKK